MTAPIQFTVAVEDDGDRLDRFIARKMPGVSRGSVVRLIQRGLVIVDSRRGQKGLRLRSGQHVVIATASTDERPIAQPELPLRIIAVRDHMVVVNKPVGIACHPLLPGETDTVANGLVGLYPECLDASPIAREGGLVHRLDVGTSGLLIAARSRRAYGHLRGLFAGSLIDKEYLALVAGRVETEGQVDRPIESVPGDRRRVRVVTERDDRGQPALSIYTPLAYLDPYTLVRVQTKTGCRHQVRIHLAHAGFPLVDDVLYGGPSHPEARGAFLHAHRMRVAGDRLMAKLPSARAEFLETLGYLGDL